MKRNYFDLFSKPNSQKELSFGNQSLIGTDDDDIITGGADNDVIEGFGGADKLDGGGGNNTLSYASSPSAVTVFLISNYASGGHAEGDEIKNFSNLIGSQHNDVLVGDWDDNIISGGDGHDIIYSYGGVNFLSGGAGNDVIYSGADSDIIDGGTGIDTISYALSNASVIVNLGGFDHSGGAATGDVLFHIENLQGSKFHDILTGTFGANSIHGLAGNDIIYGAGGNDDIRGDAGNDIIEGGSGADRLDGGRGSDTVSYRSSASHVTVNLMNNTAKGGDAFGDFIRGFERIWGTDFNDTLIGNSGRNTLMGFAGNDTIQGRSGNDFIEGGDGADRLDGGDDIDTISYRSSAASVTVNLDNGRTSGGDAQGDIIANFENIAGSEFDDTLTGDAGINIIHGYGGNDFITATEGADIIDGGNDSDIFVLSYDYIADIVKDFEDGVDIIGLDDSITFESLVISNTDGHTSIADKYDGTIYMVLENITASDITADDFITLEVV